MPETKPLPPNTSKKELLLPDELPVPNTNRTDPKGNPGLPEFTELTGSGSTQIAVGRKPLIEGLDSLKSRGFRTIAYLHAPNADLSAIRSLVEKRGLTFTPIPAAPETLKAATTQLKQLVADPLRRPVYIFDDDGIRAGSLFYYHFRTVESLNDDQARVRASALGLKEASASPLQKQFWLAIQDLLSQR
jgi:protein tyrosine phosphatase (PTP) superfamily phosphohydrolase (DUF442 family)